MSGSHPCSCSAIPGRHRAAAHNVVVYASRKPVTKAELRAASAKVHAPVSGGSEAAGVAAGVDRQPAGVSAAISPSGHGATDGGRVVTPAQPNRAPERGAAPSGGAEAHSRAAAGDARDEAGHHGRDPRLGRYANVGSLLNRCLSVLHMDANEVREVALVAKRAPAEALLDYPGGLDALFEACAHIAKQDVVAGSKR